MINLRNHRSKRLFNISSISNPTAFKDIVDGSVRLHTHLRAKTITIEGYPSEYCAVFYLGTSDYLKRNMRLHRQPKQTLSLVNGDTDCFNITQESNDLNKAMFIGFINVSENGERRLPCLIRLQALNSCHLDITQTSDVLGAITYEASFTIADREINLPLKSPVFEQPELPEQIIECSPQVVTDVANEQRNVRGNVLDLLKPEDALSCISITYKLSDDLVGAVLMHPLNQVVNDLEMIFCSAEFEERAVKRMHMLYYPSAIAQLLF